MFAVLYFNSAYVAHLPSGYIPQNSGDIIRIPEQLITAALNCLAIVVKPASTLSFSVFVFVSIDVSLM